MLLFEEKLPIDLEVLDAGDRTLSLISATVLRIDSTFAAIALADGRPPLSLRWGARVRFRLGEEDGYELGGSVIGHNLPYPRAAPDRLEDVSTHSPEVHLRLDTCRPVLQMREQPRRRLCFPVEYELLTADEPAGVSEEASAEREAWWKARTWLPGLCLDIGGGGMRLRVPLTAGLSSRIALRFSLPVTDTDAEAACLHLTGRVLRKEPGRRQAGEMELAVKFERLAAEHGLALAVLMS